MSTFMNDDEQDRANAATYEDEVTSRRTVTIPLREYDKLKEEQHFIKDKSLIAVIDKIEELVRALRKHIVRTNANE
jgi:hypothetical protein